MGAPPLCCGIRWLASLLTVSRRGDSGDGYIWGRACLAAPRHLALLSAPGPLRPGFSAPALPVRPATVTRGRWRAPKTGTRLLREAPDEGRAHAQGCEKGG